MRPTKIEHGKRHTKQKNAPKVTHIIMNVWQKWHNNRTRTDKMAVLLTMAHALHKANVHPKYTILTNKPKPTFYSAHKKNTPTIPWVLMVVARERLELSTSWLWIMRSDQLSYLAIAFKASAKIEQFSELAKLFTTFFKISGETSLSYGLLWHGWAYHT